MMLHRLTQAISLCVGIFIASSMAMAKEVVVLLDPNIRPYVEALAGFKKNADASIKIFERRENGDVGDERELIDVIRARKPDQILLIGAESMQALAGQITDIPMIFSMVLNPEDKLSDMPPNLTGVSMNVSPRRQMEVLSALMPDAKNVAVVYRPEDTRALVVRGEQACKDLNKQLIAREAETVSEAVVQAEQLMKQYPAYWMLPDAFTRSSDVIRYLYFAAGEKNRALIGVSDKYVRVGALFALTVNNESLGEQAAALSNRMLAGDKPVALPIEMAMQADLSINLKVASRMGLTVPEELKRKAKTLY